MQDCKLQSALHSKQLSFQWNSILLEERRPEEGSKQVHEEGCLRKGGIENEPRFVVCYEEPIKHLQIVNKITASLLEILAQILQIQGPNK